MKVSLNWLREYVDYGAEAATLAERLTSAGLEVSSTEKVAGDWDGVVVARVVTVEPHPNADRLTVPRVDTGRYQISVVCGAPNIEPGQKVAFAPAGTRLIDGHSGKSSILKPATIRGVRSEGMVCSEKELGISDSHEGIMVLPEDAPVGCPLEEYLADTILDVEVTPNRPDCLSMMGIAHEVAALTGSRTSDFTPGYAEEGPSVYERVAVDIEDPLLCPRYCAGYISGIKIGPSPGWLQHRLVAYGMRPINNVVDITNYVMIECGQPLHAFDYDRIPAGHIIVRRGREGETVRTIDDVERPVDDGILVIADRDRAVAVAGVMGGADTEVTEQTQTVLLEAANFDQACIRRGSQRLGLRSEASNRFEKSLNPELAMVGCRRAMQLLVDVAGGKAAAGIVDSYPGQKKPSPIGLSEQKVRQLSGLDVELPEIRRVLESLGFLCGDAGMPGQLRVVAPYWRSDVTCSADLVEEVARIVGYDKIPFRPLRATLPPPQTVPLTQLRERLRGLMVSCGLQEILTYPLTSLEKLQKLTYPPESEVAAVKVANPMSKEQEYLRTTLRANLLSTLATNQRQQEQECIRLFEIGKAFLPRGNDLPDEREMLCGVVSGARAPLSWYGGTEQVDFYDAKGVVEAMLEQLGLEGYFREWSDPTLAQGRAAGLWVGQEQVGMVGEVQPRVADHFDLTGPVCLFEVDVEKLLDKTGVVKPYRATSRFPSVTRDIALVVSETTLYGQVSDIIQRFPLVSRVTPFDIYRGKQVPEGKKSFAIRVLYRSPGRTLTDEEVDKVQGQILQQLQAELGATLRT
ncbi:MAG: phenylalanine--tRNA ligase subunit beta [Chloroflexota bacterium]